MCPTPLLRIVLQILGGTTEYSSSKSFGVLELRHFETAGFLIGDSSSIIPGERHLSQRQRPLIQTQSV